MNILPQLTYSVSFSVILFKINLKLRTITTEKKREKTHSYTANFGVIWTIQTKYGAIELRPFFSYSRMRCWFFSQNVSSALFFLSLLTCGEVYIIVKKERLLSTNSQEVIFSAHESNRIQPVKISFECIDTRLKSFLSSNLLSLFALLCLARCFTMFCALIHRPVRTMQATEQRQWKKNSVLYIPLGQWIYPKYICRHTLVIQSICFRIFSSRISKVKQSSFRSLSEYCSTKKEVDVHNLLFDKLFVSWNKQD